MARFELQKLYIDGATATLAAMPPSKPSTRLTVKSSPKCNATKEDVERAVVSAEKGQKIWAAMTAMERSRILRRAVDILRERNDELAAGNPGHRQAFSETKYVDIVTGADVLEYYAGLVPAIEGEQIRCATPRSSTPAASRWAWSPVSARGTTRSRSPCGNPHRPWPPATR
jgi:betaine-aldehyde dehydrogenase